MIRTRLMLAAATLAGLAASADIVLAQPAPPGAGAAPEVAYIETKLEPVPFTNRLPGRVLASRSVEIRPRVSGVIEEVAFEEGRRVSKGDLLYRISSETYESDAELARAQLAEAQAALPEAQADVDRYEKIVNSGATVMDLEGARTTLAETKAKIAAAEASLRAAELSLSFTQIKAPLDGVIGKSSVVEGALVTENQDTALATIDKLNPVYVDLSDTNSNLLRFRAMMRSGEIQPTEQRGPTEITLQLEDGSTYQGKGEFLTPYSSISETTGSFTIRTQFDNPHRILLPGMFVVAAITHGTQSAALVPQRAATRDAAGSLVVYFIDKDGKAEKRTLRADRAYRNSWIVTSGVEPGEKLIVDGFQKIQDGAEVTAVAATISDAGDVVLTSSGD